MSSLFSQVRNGIIFSVTCLTCFGIAYAAISWPAAPSGETAGGKYSAKLVPTGFVGAFNGTTCPTGWSAADGSGDEKNTAWVNTTLDLRGEFIRGLDSGRNVDTGRALASWQKPTIVSHDWGANNRIAGIITDDLPAVGLESPVISGYTSHPSTVTVGLIAATSTYTSVSYPLLHSNMHWGTTRPRNVALLYCVKD